MASRKPIYARVLTAIARALNLNMLRPGMFYVHTTVVDFWQDVRGQKDREITFNEALCLYGINEEQLKAKYHCYLQQAYWFFILMCVFFVFMVVTVPFTRFGALLRAGLLELCLGLMVLRCMYYCHMIRERNLSISLWRWLSRSITKRSG